MPSLRTILYPQRTPTEPYSLKLDLSEATSSAQGIINATLVDQINQELYDLTIIKNSRLLDSYKDTIRYLVDQKKIDVQEVHDYIKKRDGEVAEYKQRIEELTKVALVEPRSDSTEAAEPNSSTIEMANEESVDKTQDLDCSIEQLLRRQLDRSSIEYTLEVISISRPFALMLTIGEVRILVEITSASRRTNDSTINSFKARVGSSEVACGIFISMEQGYTLKSGISDFSLACADGKYLLYLANLESDHHKFKNAINILLQLTQKKISNAESIEQSIPSE